MEDDGNLTSVDPPIEDRPTAIDRPRTPPLESKIPSHPTSIITATDALRDEEVHRTRLFIRLGWLASIAGLGTIPMVKSEPHVTVAFVITLLGGMIVSFGFHQAFRDPRRFTQRALFALGVMCVVNAHVMILFFGAFTLAPALIVVGLHFVGRSELGARRAVWFTAIACHGAIAIALIAAQVPDPGVFATARPLGTGAYVIGALYVQAAYALAYMTGRIQRRVSLRSIEQLQRATRVASQRAALLDELRYDLERAQQAGAGRYTGQAVGGYALGMLIGRGAHGEVYEAIEVATSTPVAVKLLRPEHLVDPTTVARFVREVRATAALASPHIVRVLATSEPDAQLPYLAMERLTGFTLAERLRRTPVMAPADVVTLVAHVGAAIDAARGTGIVHRDLKPQNLIAVDDIWKVLDYGVAALGEQTGTLTQGGIVGTPQYMAPEQARAAHVDHRADLYALGTVAYRALTGRNAFGGVDTPALLYAVVHTMPEAPSASGTLGAIGAVLTDVDRWVALAIAKDPADRFDSGAALASSLRDALRGALAVDARAAADRVLAKTPWRPS